jgi:hypothetical protein
VHANGRPDSLGEIIGKPVFKQGEEEYDPDRMSYNFKTRRGFISNVYTQQGEGYMMSEESKRDSTGVMYVRKGRYTTCDAEHPHFYLRLTKAKVRPGQTVVFGPAYLVVEDVPLPLAIPYGFFPFSSSYHSGFIMPTYGDESSRGFYLREGGYYFAINDNVDLKLLGEIYTKGSWGLSAYSTYNLRYKFAGNVMFSFQNTILGEKNMPDYSVTRSLKFTWSHRQDPKANPTQSFSASVNFASVDYERNNLVSMYNPESYTQSTRTSSVSYSKTFKDIGLTLSASFNLSQNMRDSSISVTLPTLNVTLARINPFKRKKQAGKEKWYEKIALSYTGTLSNSITTKENKLFKSNLIKDWRNGMMHTIPVQATFNVFKYFNLTPNITMNDRMYTSKIRQQWDPNASAVVRDTTYGFYNIFDFNFGVSLSTKVYGFFKPLKFLGKLSEKLQMVRHVMTPTISFSASPDFGSPFWGYFGNYEREYSDGRVEPVRYSYFQHTLFGNAPNQKSGTITFNIANNLEAKIKSENDSTGFKKISLIENFTLSQSCNLAADSLKWSNLNTSIMLRLVKGFNLNLSATWDVYKYALNASGTPVRINKLRLFNGGGWGRLSSTGTSFSYTFNNDTFRRKKDRTKNAEESQKQSQNNLNRDSNKEGEDHEGTGQTTDLELIDGYAKWECPWSLTVNYSLSYGYGTFNYDKLEYNGKWTQNLSLNANIRPTKNWSFTASASYNFDTHKIAYMNCSISRQMHCFVMSASFVPVGPYKSYNFHIAVKSSILQDVKYDKHSSMSNGITWY